MNAEYPKHHIEAEPLPNFSPERGERRATILADFNDYLFEGEPTWDGFTERFDVSKLSPQEQRYFQQALETYQGIENHAAAAEQAMREVKRQANLDDSPSALGTMLFANIYKRRPNAPIRMARQGAMITLHLEDPSDFAHADGVPQGEKLAAGLFGNHNVRIGNESFSLGIIVIDASTSRDRQQEFALVKHERQHLLYSDVYRIPESRSADKWHKADGVKNEIIAFLSEGGYHPSNIQRELLSDAYAGEFAPLNDTERAEFMPLFEQTITELTQFDDDLDGIYTSRLALILMHEPLERFPEVIKTMREHYAKKLSTSKMAA